jgi:glutaminyl-tRNA synthetase
MKITRFPPEPNGYLHIGHLKAMLADFEYFENCACILRLDDTNPEAEKQEYVDAIIRDVEWLGFRYDRITYTSDYFDQLYEFAITLIRMDCAYVDRTSAIEIKDMRHDGICSTDRSNSVDQNLHLFSDMRNGVFGENEAVLRLKIDMSNPNHCLRDPIAYRVKLTPHYRTGKKWVIYPSYDYSHGLVDALEQITDSFCTMEFFDRRDQYYWPVDKLAESHNLKKAKVLEFGRLNIEGVELSKRKIVPLVESGKISGFDDPRLYTIAGLRRRGYTPEILKNIVRHTGMGRQTSTIAKSLIEFELRNYFDKMCHRVFAVIDPISLQIQDETNDQLDVWCPHQNHPVDKTMGSHQTLLSKNIFIEKSDFREVDSPNYYRLAPSKTIRLKYADFITYVSHVQHKIICKNVVPENPKKIKGIIHWVDSSSPKAICVTYEDLYNSDGSIKTNSNINESECYIEQYVMDMLTKNPMANHIFQFERLGYFKFDRFIFIPDGIVIPLFIKVIDLVDNYKN